MIHRLESKRLYIADLARRQHDMERGRVALQPLAYRVLARRLREALDGLPERLLHAGLAELPPRLLPGLAEVLEARHFDEHGLLFGPGAPASRAEAEALFRRLR